MKKSRYSQKIRTENLNGKFAWKHRQEIDNKQKLYNKEKTSEYIGTKRKKKTTQVKMTIQLKKIYQKVLAKKGRLNDIETR